MALPSRGECCLLQPAHRRRPCPPGGHLNGSRPAVGRAGHTPRLRHLGDRTRILGCPRISGCVFGGLADLHRPPPCRGRHGRRICVRRIRRDHQRGVRRRGSRRDRARLHHVEWRRRDAKGNVVESASTRTRSASVGRQRIGRLRSNRGRLVQRRSRRDRRGASRIIRAHISQTEKRVLPALKRNAVIIEGREA